MQPLLQSSVLHDFRNHSNMLIYHVLKNYKTINIGLVSQTGLRLSQDKAIVQLGHLSHFYKRTLEKNITVMHFETK